MSGALRRLKRRGELSPRAPHLERQFMWHALSDGRPLACLRARPRLSGTASLVARPVGDEQATTMHRIGEHIAREKRCAGEIDARVDALRSLNGERVRYLVAGAYAFFEYTGIFRDTKDLDVVLRRQDLDHALGALERAGFRTELLDPVWIAKGYRGD